MPQPPHGESSRAAHTLPLFGGEVAGLTSDAYSIRGWAAGAVVRPLCRFGPVGSICDGAVLTIIVMEGRRSFGGAAPPPSRQRRYAPGPSGRLCSAVAPPARMTFPNVALGAVSMETVRTWHAVSRYDNPGNRRWREAAECSCRRAT